MRVEQQGPGGLETRAGGPGGGGVRGIEPPATPPRVLGRQPGEPGWEDLVAAARLLGPDATLADVDDVALARRVREGAVAIAAATANWLTLVAELVVRGVWAEEGASSPGAWLGWACGMAPSTAREHVRVALRLRELPAIRAAFSDGRVSYSKVRAITRVAEPSFESTLLRWCDAAPAAVIERMVSAWRRQARAGEASPHERAGRRAAARRAAGGRRRPGRHQWPRPPHARRVGHGS